MFAFCKTLPLGTLDLPGLTLSPLPVDSLTAKFDLTLVMSERGGGVEGPLEYSTELFEAATIERMGAASPDPVGGHRSRLRQRLSELPLLTEAEWRQVVVAWNATETAYPRERCIHQLFEAQVERTPEAVAVVFEDEWLTYASSIPGPISWRTISKA